MTDRIPACPVYVQGIEFLWPYTPDPARRAAWEDILAMPGARIVALDGSLATPAQTAAIVESMMNSDDGLHPADVSPVRRIGAEDLVHEEDVVAMLRVATSNRQSAAFARAVGVHKTLIGQILRGDRRPCTRVLEHLGYMRIAKTRVYIRKQSWMLTNLPDRRGGPGGTERMRA